MILISAYPMEDETVYSTRPDFDVVRGRRTLLKD